MDPRDLTDLRTIPGMTTEKWSPVKSALRLPLTKESSVKASIGHDHAAAFARAVRDRPQSVPESADDLQDSCAKDSPEKSEGGGLLSFEEEFKGPPGSSPKQANYLADQFFQQSHRIQSEIQSLAEYCKGLTAFAQTPTHEDPSQDEMTQESEHQLDDTEDLVRQWVKINSMLEESGLQQLELYFDENYRQVPDASAVASCIIELLTELDTRTRALKSSEKEANSLAQDFNDVSEEHQRLQKYIESAQEVKDQLRHLRAKHDNLISLHRLVKEKYHNLKRRSLRNSEVLRDSTSSLDLGGTKDAFKRYMHRDVREGSHSDKQVLRLIADFEKTIERLKDEQTQLRTDKTTLEDRVKKVETGDSICQATWENERRRLFNEIAQLKQSASPGLIQEICHKLEVDSPSQLMKSIEAMQQILKALPSIEQFVKNVVQEVLDDSATSQLEDVVPRLRALKREASRLIKLRADICIALGVEATSQDKLVVRAN